MQGGQEESLGVAVPSAASRSPWMVASRSSASSAVVSLRRAHDVSPRCCFASGAAQRKVRELAYGTTSTQTPPTQLALRRRAARRFCLPAWTGGAVSGSAAAPRTRVQAALCKHCMRMPPHAMLVLLAAAPASEDLTCAAFGTVNAPWCHPIQVQIKGKKPFLLNEWL